MSTESDYEPRNPRYGPLLVLGLFAAKLHRVGAFGGHCPGGSRQIMECETSKGLFDARDPVQSRHVPSVLLRLAVLNRLQAGCRRKIAFCWPKPAQISEGTSRLGAQAPPLSWGLKLWIGTATCQCRGCPE